MSDQEKFEELSELFTESMRFFGLLQQEMASALFLKHPGLRESVEAQIAGADHLINQQLHDAMLEVVRVMPLASLYGVNLFAALAGVHSQLTGEETVALLIKRSNEAILEQLNS